jgi:hypothetical protein
MYQIIDKHSRLVSLKHSKYYKQAESFWQYMLTASFEYLITCFSCNNLSRKSSFQCMQGLNFYVRVHTVYTYRLVTMHVQQYQGFVERYCSHLYKITCSYHVHILDVTL